MAGGENASCLSVRRHLPENLCEPPLEAETLNRPFAICQGAEKTVKIAFEEKESEEAYGLPGYNGLNDGRRESEQVHGTVTLVILKSSPD